jgi:replicative DNA helicase Mcm
MATKQIKDDSLIKDFREFFGKYYEDEIAELAQRYPNDQKSLYIDFQTLYRFDVDIADDLLSKPQQILEYAQEALRCYDLPVDISLADANVRVTNVPGQHEYSIDDTRVDHRGSYLSVRGLVQKASAVKPKITNAAYECQRCGTLTRIPQVDGDRQEPHECQGCERQGPFRINFDQSEFIDHQLLRLQQPPEETNGGQGETIDVVVEDDLANAATAGDRIHAHGVYKLERDDNDREKDVVFDTYLDGQAIEKEEQDFEEIDFSEYESEIKAIANGEHGDPLEVMVEAVAPGLYGMDAEKRAALLQLFGGTKSSLPDGSTIRGDFHVLLLGDPGCGKSTLLDAIKEIAPRATKASGKGASAAGMTAAAVRDDFGQSEWGLEAGALVMADGGIACVDEIDKIDDSAVSSLHNALEAQQVEIAKAGINATLPAETSLLAAGNPKYGRFDHYEPIGKQIDLAPSLMSRFDLIFTLSEQPDPDEDGELAKHMLETKREATLNSHSDKPTTEPDSTSVEIETDVLRAYIAFARQNIHPHVPEELDGKVVDWFVEFRQAGDDSDSPVPVTARKVEAIERLAEAHARARLSDTVTEDDLRSATSLVERSLRNVGLDPETGQFDADMVETGTSKNQRERVKDLLSIIEEKQREFDAGVPKEVILQEAMDLGYSKERAESEIDQNLLEKGEIYEPQDGHFRTT